MKYPIARQTVMEGARSLHFRRLGSGAPVVLLHESPRSSLALMPLAERLAGDFTVFALDTPGYGDSDRLPLARPSIEDFGDAIVRSLRTAGLSRVPVYGTHTGATIAAAIAVRHRDFVSGLVLDGYPVFTRQERELHEAVYLPGFPPRWDGSHIVALWSRVRDQYNFFPWYLRGETARLSSQNPGLERHRAVFHDFLRSGDAYALAYSASFRFEPLTTLAALRVPFHVIARDSDVLRDHLERLPPLPQGCSASPASADSDGWAADVADLLRFMPGQHTAPPLLDRLDSAPQGVRCIAGGSLFVRCYGEMSDKPALLLIHDTPGSALLVADEAKRRSTDRLVIAPELPGHGASPPLAGGLTAFLDALGAALQSFGASIADIEGSGSGDRVAKAIAAARPDKFRHNRGGSVSALSQALADAPLPPRFDGADLLAMWYGIREQALAEARGQEQTELLAGVDVERLHARFVALCLAGGHDRAFLEALD